ncbi:MAG TPA: protease complex subunit PrcB family protein [Candidatus Nanoarchaeia archaeon]|nr:protease complex subunit PrcB family protein [Candidatus Nanoarchaeia archaeon]
MKRLGKKRRKPAKKTLLLLVSIFILLALVFLRLSESKGVSNFDDCVAAGYKVFEEEDPQRCVSPDGRVFVAKIDFKPVASAATAGAPDVKNIDFVVVVQSSGPSSTKLSTAVRSQAEWQDVWGRLYAGIDPLPPLLPIDFTKEMLVAVADGARPTSGFSTKINNITQTSSQLIVGATAFGPGKNCKTTALPQREANYYNVVRLPFSKLPVSFDIKSELRDC